MQNCCHIVHIVLVYAPIQTYMMTRGTSNGIEINGFLMCLCYMASFVLVMHIEYAQQNMHGFFVQAYTFFVIKSILLHRLCYKWFKHMAIKNLVYKSAYLDILQKQ